MHPQHLSSIHPQHPSSSDVLPWSRPPRRARSVPPPHCPPLSLLLSRVWAHHRTRRPEQALGKTRGRAKQGLGDLEKGGKRRGQNHSVADASAFLLPCAPDHVLLCVFQDNGQHVSHGEKRGQHREAGSGSEQRAAAGWAGCRSRAASDQQRCLRCRQARRHRGQAWGTEGERDQRE